MTVVVSFRDWEPAERYDELPWTEVRIEEAATALGAWTQIDVVAFDEYDEDPSDPAARSFTTELGTDVDLWYRLIFADADGDTQIPTAPIQNSDAVAPYATVAELAGILQVNAVTNADALERVLLAASGEIDSELGLDDQYSVPPALVVQVCLERATEHWQQMKNPFGILALGGVEQPAFTGADTWNRHAHKLAPLKESWGLAQVAENREIMDALAAQLEAQLDGDINGLQVVGRLMWNPTPPAIDIYPGSPSQDALSYGGYKELFFTVRARVATPDHEGAQELLLAMMDPRSAESVEAAIRADKTLGGVVDNANVMPDSPSDYGAFVDPGGSALLGCTWRVRVIP